MKQNMLILTCEHGGNKIPKVFAERFKKARRVLESHRGWDIGVLKIAKQLQKALNAPLFYSETSRLLVDLNRSEHHRRVFSEYMQGFSKEEREEIFCRYHRPYRDLVTKAIQTQLRRHRSVLHLSLHSFTPALNGEVRSCEIGLLFDPSRKGEREFCDEMKRRLRIVLPDLRVRFNYPYRGVSDGFQRSLRKSFSQHLYGGIELEINQALLSQVIKRRQEGLLSQHLAWCIGGAIGAVKRQSKFSVFQVRRQ